MPRLNESRNRHFSLTRNNPAITMAEELAAAQAAGATCFAGQLERGEEGTPHHQMFMSFKNNKSLSAMRKLFKGCHIEVARDPLKCYEYCQKADTRVGDEQPTVWGEIPKPRMNTAGDTKKFNQLCLERGPEALVDDGQLHLRDYKKIRDAVHLYRMVTDKPKDLEILDNQWIYGPPRVGKSRGVRLDYPDYYPKNPNKWWDGYIKQETVLLDDIGPEHKFMSYYIKVWADHYSFTAESKGGSQYIRPKRIIVTSNYHPDDIWKDDPVLLAAIKSRFKIIHKLGNALEQPILRPNPFAKVKDELDEQFQIIS